MGKMIYLNNKLVPEEKACVSVFDRSYLYGEGVFETMRSYKGHVAFSDLHYERLRQNSKRLNIELPLDKHSFEKAILKTINANKLKDAYIRVTLSPVGASIGMKKPKKVSTNLSIFCREFIARPEAVYQEGGKVILVRSVPSDHPIMANIKSTNYLSKMMARDEVITAGVDEGIFCSQSGNVLEGSATNIFIVKNGEIFTPPISEGILPGITRKLVINLAEANGFTLHETSISIKDLQEADEIFLTGSTTEILPIREVVELCKKSPTPGRATKKLMEAYKALLP